MVKAIIMVLAFIAALVLAPEAASTEFVDLQEGFIVVPMATDLKIHRVHPRPFPLSSNTCY